MDYYIDNYNFKGFGIYVQESTGVVDLPKFKPPTETDWAEYHGVIIDSNKTPRTEPRTIQLKCFLKAENQVDFLTKLSAFQSVFMTKGLKRLAIILTNEVGLFFDVYMSDGLQVTKRWSDSTMVGQFTVNLCEPEPIKKIIRFDSQGSASTLSFQSSEAVSIYWGDGTAQQDLYGNVSLSHTYDEAGIYFAIIHGNIDNITDLTTSGDVLTTNNGGNIEIEIPEILNGALESVELFNVAEPGVSQLTPYIRFAFNNNSETRYLRITIDANDEWLEQITIINNRLNAITADITSLQSNKADKTQLTPLQQSIATNATNIANNTSAITSINNKIGEPNGIAELDTNGKVPQSQLPSFVDDVVEYASVSDFPPTGESGKIYIARDTNITYRWGGSTYVHIGSDLALGETASTAYRGDRGQTAYDHSQTEGNPHNTTIAQISGLQDALNGKQPTIGKNEFLKQVSDLDNYNAQNGEIVEYIGSTTSNYVNGYTYKFKNISVPQKSIVVESNNYGVAEGVYEYESNANPIVNLQQTYKNYGDNNDEQLYYGGIFNDMQEVGDYVWNNNGDVFTIVSISHTYPYPLLVTLNNGVQLFSAQQKSVALYIYKDVNNRIIYSNYNPNGVTNIWQLGTELRSDSTSQVAVMLPIGKMFNNGEFYHNNTNLQRWLQNDVQPRTDTSTIESDIAALQTDKANEVTSFTEAAIRANIASGDTVTTIWGKVNKFFTDLKEVAFSGSYNDLSNKGFENRVDYCINLSPNKNLLIADIDTFYRASSSTIDLPRQGFVGFASLYRSAGNLEDGSSPISMVVSYKNDNDHIRLGSLDNDLIPAIMLYNNKYYLGFYMPKKNGLKKLTLSGNFQNCLNEFLFVNFDDCTLVQAGNIPLNNATTSAAGLMSANDKNHIQNITKNYYNAYSNVAVNTIINNIIRARENGYYTETGSAVFNSNCSELPNNTVTLVEWFRGGNMGYKTFLKAFTDDNKFWVGYFMSGTTPSSIMWKQVVTIS